MEQGKCHALVARGAVQGDVPPVAELDMLALCVPMVKWKRLAGLIATIVMAKARGMLMEND